MIGAHPARRVGSSVSDRWPPTETVAWGPCVARPRLAGRCTTKGARHLPLVKGLPVIAVALSPLSREFGPQAFSHVINDAGNSPDQVRSGYVSGYLPRLVVGLCHLSNRGDGL